MQRVVRSTFAGLLILAGLTACGDKVTVPGLTTTTPPNVVHSVTVTPATATLTQAVAGVAADKVTLAVSVDADAGVTDRTVTWASANSAIASVDQAGVVTAGTTAGTTTITASSKVAPDVKGAALITVTPSGGNGAQPTVSISTINQTVCVAGGACTSIPANLGSVAGQIDVTLNVDPGAQKLAGVDLLMNCTGAGNSAADTVVATQNLVTSNLAPSAEAASAPVTLSFNTGSFNATTGAVSFRNGTCTIKARARTTTGTTTSTVTQNITLNNTDVVVGTVTASNNKINPVTGQVWSGGTVTVAVTPILYTPNRAVRLVNVTFAGRTATALGSPTSGTLSGAQSFSFVDGNGATVAAPGTDIDGITNAAATATFAAADTLGGAIVNTVVGGNVCGPTAICSQTTVLAGASTAIPVLRLDTQKPDRGSLTILNNALQQTGPSGYLGANFRFVADSAAGFVGPNPLVAAGGLTGLSCFGATAGLSNPITCNLDNGGVDSVTVVFFSNTTASRTAGSANLITNTSGLLETVASNTNTLDMITSDLLGNRDTSFAGPGNTAATSTFGVDKNPPRITFTGVADQQSASAVGALGPMANSITDTLSGPGQSQLVAQTILNATVNSATLPANGAQNGTVAAPGTVNSGCIVGRFNRTSGAAAADVSALPVFDKTGTQIGTCSPIAIPLATAQSLNTNVAGTSGYVTTRVVAVDIAGNRAAATTLTIVEDAVSPTAGAIDLPPSLSGGTAATFPLTVNDNLDITQATLQLTYNNQPMTFQMPFTAGPGVAFDNVLSPGGTSTTASATVPFFARNLITNPGATRPGVPTPTQTANGPNTIAGGVLDEVSRNAFGNPVSLTGTTTVAQPSSNPWASDFTGGTTIAASNATVSDCPTAGCVGTGAPANPTSTVLTVTAAGVSGTFANPFTRVEVWYQVNGVNAWFLAGSSTAGISRDTGPTPGQRFWDYAVSFTPPKVAPRDVATGAATGLTGGANLSVIGIGFNATGDGIVTAPIVVTLTNP